MSTRKDDPKEMEQMRAWLRAAAIEIGVDTAEYEDLEGPLLDLTRVIAHGPSRPAAPLTTFLVGLAAGMGADPETDIERLLDLAEEYDHSDSDL